MSQIYRTRNGRTVGKLCNYCIVIFPQYAVYVCVYVGHIYTFLLSICSIGGYNLFCSQELYPWLSSEMLEKNVARKQVWWLNHSHLLDQWAGLWIAKHVFSQTESLVAIYTVWKSQMIYRIVYYHIILPFVCYIYVHYIYVFGKLQDIPFFAGGLTPRR